MPRSERNAAFAEVRAELTARKTAIDAGAAGGWWFSRNASEKFSDVIITLMTPALDKVCDGHDRAEQLYRLTVTAFALEAYRAERGRYPDKCERLVPEYLPEVPGDLFGDRPPRYRRTPDGYLLYSVGPNGEDDGGGHAETGPHQPNWAGELTPADDIAVRVPPDMQG